MKRKIFGFVISFCLLCTFESLSAVPGVSILTDTSLEPAAQHGIAKLEQVLAERQIPVQAIRSLGDIAGDYCIVAGTASGNGPAVAILRERGISLPDGQEALVVRKLEYNGVRTLVLCGSDARGLMYAALDVADRLSWSSRSDDLLHHVHNVTEQPDILERSVSMYTMHRRTFEQRLYDKAHWERYFDMLAQNRINSFVVIFGYENGGFMAPPYPYFFNVDGFPDVRMVGLSAEEQKRNTRAFRQMISIAHQRGVDFIPAIWDHIYRGGVQGGGIPDADKAKESPTTGLVWGVTAENLASYNKAALQKFLEVFPGIDGMQFRMHGESGLTREEIPVFWHEIFQMFKQMKPDMRVDIRAKQLPDEVIADGLAQGINLRVATKYWMEQMGLPFHPVHVNPPNQKSRRHGYADLLKYPQQYKVHWRMWSGGTTRVLLWGSPEYARRFANSAKLYGGNSFEVNEMLATKGLTQPHEEAPFELLNPQYHYYDWEFERYWHFYQSFGRLGYNPDTPEEVWAEEFNKRFGSEVGPSIMKGLHLASEVLPHIVAASYRYILFPTTRGWAGRQRMGDLKTYANAEGSDKQLFADFKEEADFILRGKETAQQRPQKTSRWFKQTSASILEQVALAESLAGNNPGDEFTSTITDLKILAYLSLYHGERMPAGVSYQLFEQSQDLFALDSAIRHESRAIRAWKQLVEAAGDVYSSDLIMGVSYADLKANPNRNDIRRSDMRGHWKDDLAWMESDLKQLKQLRESIGPKAGEKGLRIAHVPIRSMRPGKELTIRATLYAASEIEKVQCVFKTENGASQYANMHAGGHGRFTTKIPSNEEGDKLSYYLLAETSDGAKEQTDPVNVIISKDRKPPTVRHEGITKSQVGKPLRVTANVKDASGVKWVRLRYRHLTQFEDYETLEMRLDRSTGKYTATIPGDFVVPEWDLIYFIEAMDTEGNGVMFPDFEKEAPYFIVNLHSGG